MKKSWIAFALVFSIILVSGISGCQKASTNKQIISDNFPNITGICNVELEFSSNNGVNTNADVEKIFNQFLTYSKENNQYIFSDPASNWKFNNSIVHGQYNGKKYWEVIALRFDNISQIWRKDSSFDISENGEVVRLWQCYYKI